VLAPHNRFRFNARFFELLDAIIKVSLVPFSQPFMG
jgi:hypothetical protein